MHQNYCQHNSHSLLRLVILFSYLQESKHQILILNKCMFVESFNMLLISITINKHKMLQNKRKKSQCKQKIQVSPVNCPKNQNQICNWRQNIQYVIVIRNLILNISTYFVIRNLFLNISTYFQKVSSVETKLKLMSQFCAQQDMQHSIQNIHIYIYMFCHLKNWQNIICKQKFSTNICQFWILNFIDWIRNIQNILYKIYLHIYIVKQISRILIVNNNSRLITIRFWILNCIDYGFFNK
eukprot:TRINITY_DN9090_c0_g1_i14.p1 TRINITY_DN9090_c0_g1~~TRINITY_DN9090_c0_g1_i14.p1  ORF type:complete len:239 (+),score=-23.20 TRINITY_DN9090_c0_g1_i14:799-1515(+)